MFGDFLFYSFKLLRTFHEITAKFYWKYIMLDSFGKCLNGITLDFFLWHKFYGASQLYLIFIVVFVAFPMAISILPYCLL